MLEDCYPGVRFEVVNAAVTAVNSHVVLPIVRECTRLEPDLFIVYMGNNEVVGPYGAGTVFAPLRSNLSPIRAAIMLKGTRLGQMLGNIGKILRRDRSADAETWRGMEMFLNNSVAASDRRLETVYSHYERNLMDIRRVARKARIPIVFSTIAVNLKDSPPFGSAHSTGLAPDELNQWEKRYAEGVSLEKQDQCAAALAEYLKAEAIDSEYADLQFHVAQCYWKLGDFDDSRSRYIKALDLDVFRFRAVPKINSIIRACAAGRSKEGCFLLDAEREIVNNSDHGVPGGEFFYDHVHFTFRGTYVVSCALFEQIQIALPDWVCAHDSGRSLLSLEECARRVPYTDWNRYMSALVVRDYMKDPPFTGQIDARERLSNQQRILDDLAKRMSEKETIDNLIAQYETVFRDYDTHWSPHHDCAYIQYGYNRNPVEAEKHWRITIQRCPNFRQGYLSLGRALSAQGKLGEAADSFRRLIETDPLNQSAYVDLSVVLRAMGENEEAINVLKNCIRQDPNADRARAALDELRSPQ
jgi:tetratricopeptide (TPR) repeat protein